MRTTTTLLLAIVLLASCNQYQKTPSGLTYKITKGSGKEKLKQGQFVKFNVEFRIPPKDSIFNTSYGHIPGYLVMDTARASKHSFLEILPLCASGDKVDFVMSVDSLKKMGALEYNNYFHQRDLIKGKLEILAVFNSQDLANADVQKEVELEKQREVKDLKAYTAKLGIKTLTTPSGALVEIVDAGEAQKADSGKEVKVMYKGSLTTGAEFDANMGKNARSNQPLSVNIGANGGPGTVVKGMDEGLRYFGKGGKGRIFIPAMLGYGQNGQPPVIPAYSNLVFDVEIVSVNAPAPPAPVAAPKK
jgi:FKBP-type peptidyl-prolyl cis-trans isomerase